MSRNNAGSGTMPESHNWKKLISSLSCLTNRRPKSKSKAEGKKGTETPRSGRPKWKCFRVIEILPGNAPDVISCNFHSLNINNRCQLDPDYTALSYTWGDSIFRYLILIHRTKFMIAENLWRFLHQMREHGTTELFWIDAICIDQGNITEKNYQLSLMKDIYKSPSRVLVWFGPEADNSDLAINRINRGDEPWADKRRRIPLLWTAEEDRAIYALCQRSYWKRIWIVQEFVLNESLVLYCGSQILAWQKLSELFYGLQDVKVWKPFEHHPSHPLAVQLKSSYAADVVARRQENRCLTMEPFGFALDNLIETYKNMESTDARDKVYGLLGLLRNDEIEIFGINADYAKSARDIYNEVLEASCRHYKWGNYRQAEFGRILLETLGLADRPTIENWGGRALLPE